MALTFQSGDSIKQALYEELQNILNPDSDVRTAAEERIKQLQFTEGYGFFLAELSMNQSLPLDLRQLSSVMLKKYVEEHWNCSDAGSGVIVTDAAKRAICNILPNGLYDPNSKIRTSVAYVISTIASYDWPETWTELFDIIVKCLAGNQDSVHGAMQVLVEFTYDLNEQTSVVGPIIISEIYRIIEAEQFYSVKTRSCAVKIFKALLISINDHIPCKEKQSKMLLPFLDGFMNKFIAGLSNTNQFSNFVMKKEIIKVFIYMVNTLPKYMKPYANEILQPIWQLLTQTADIYVKVIVNEESQPLTNKGEDNEIDDFIMMVTQMLEFIHALVESMHFKVHVKNVLTDLIYIMIVYMQIPQENLDDWSENTDKFVEDECQDGMDSNSIRGVSRSVLSSISLDYDENALSALNEALTRHINVADAEKSNGNSNWWKIHEASMTAVGHYKSLILQKPDKFNITQYLSYVRNMVSSNQGQSSYLFGRCLRVLSRFSRANFYNDQTLAEILDNIENSLSSDKPAYLRIYAILSIVDLCESLQHSSTERCVLIVSKLGVFIDGIFTMLPISKSSVFLLLIEALSTIVSVDTNFTASIHNKIIPLTIALFLKHHEDPYLVEIIKDIITILSQNEYCLGPLQEKIIPTLASILNAEHGNSLLQEMSLDVLQIIVKHSKPPLSDQLIEVAFPAAVQCILRSDDSVILQSGGECLRIFLSVSPQQVCSYKNGEGLKYIVTVTEMLLNPMSGEYTAAYIGRLVITLINKAGNILGDNINLLLKAVISKLQLVESLAVAMSLVVTFAHLFVIQMEAVLNFLSTVPGPSGEPAIQFIFTHWLTRQSSFYGVYERKISTLALCKLLQHGVTSKDVRLTTVTIREQIDVSTAPSTTEAAASSSSSSSPSSSVANTNKYRTRSHTSKQQQQWTTIPVLVKIFKLLINELSHLREISNSEDDVNDTNDEDSDNEKSILLSDLNLNEDEYSNKGDDDDECLFQELAQNPFFQGNMEQKLTEYLKEFCKNALFSEFIGHLNEAEKLVLRSIQVIV